MTDKRISELDPGTVLAAADLIPIAKELSPGVYGTQRVSAVTAQTYMLTLPIQSKNTSSTVQAGVGGVMANVLRADSPTAITLTIRENTGVPSVDFAVGNYFSVIQVGAGQVTLAPESANVVLRKPLALNLKTREQYSVITATLFDITGAVETWVISGDLELA